MDVAPTGVLVNILRRLPSASWRRLRLVCRHWRDSIDRSPELRTARAKPLLYVEHEDYETPSTPRASAYIIDDDDDKPEGERCRELWTGDSGVAVVGSCNGLLCLCDNEEPAGGALTVFNPFTGEELVVPPLPDLDDEIEMASWHETYSFVCDFSTGQHKIVHIPCYSKCYAKFDTVQVFTLGDPSWSWRDVPASGASRNLGPGGWLMGGLVSVGSVTYWIGKGSKKLMSFDVRDERLDAVSLPVSASLGYEFRLVVVHGELGVAVTEDTPVLRNVNTEVWVLETMGWSHRYDVPLHALGHHELASPLFAHGDHVLTVKDGWAGESSVIYGQKVHESALSLQLVNSNKRSKVLANVKGSIERVFVHVETTEPLSGLECTSY